MAQPKQMRLASMRRQVRSLALLSVQGSDGAMSCGVGRRCNLDPALLWLWGRLAAAAPIRPLARELPYAAREALKSLKCNWMSCILSVNPTPMSNVTLGKCLFLS